MAPLDLCVFDAAVQHGPSRAAKWLQRVVGAKQDGKIGPKTLTALALLIERDGLEAVIGYYMEIREEFYDDIVERDISQMVFRKGWRNRMDSLRKEMV
jgi:lysozyme family protein